MDNSDGGNGFLAAAGKGVDGGPPGSSSAAAVGPSQVEVMHQLQVMHQLFLLEERFATLERKIDAVMEEQRGNAARSGSTEGPPEGESAHRISEPWSFRRKVAFEELGRTRSPQSKRMITPSQDSDEEQQNRLAEWKEAAEADRAQAKAWKAPEITEEGQRQAEAALKRAHKTLAEQAAESRSRAGDLLVEPKHEPKMEVTIGQQLDTVATTMMKARRLAEKSTKHYLESNCDSAAKALLGVYVCGHSASDFYMAFFQRHALVFGIRGPVLNWNCWDTSECCVKLMQELTASGRTTGPLEADSVHRIPEFGPFQRNVRPKHEPKTKTDMNS